MSAFIAIERGVSKVAAVGLLLGVIWFIGAILVEPLTARLSDAQDQIAQERQLLGRLLAEARGLSARPAEDASGEPALLPGETEAEKIAALQSRVETVAASAGVLAQQCAADGRAVSGAPSPDWIASDRIRIDRRCAAIFSRDRTWPSGIDHSVSRHGSHGTRPGGQRRTGFADQHHGRRYVHCPGAAMMKVIRMVLAVGVVLLAGAAVKSALDVVDVSPVSPSSATSPGPVAAKPQFIVPALDEMKETRERPLFVVTRRPADATEVASQADDLRGLTLIGLDASGRKRRTCADPRGGRKFRDVGGSRW